MNNLKVYIVIRKDLKMRRGKEIAQACHAMQYLCEIIKDTAGWNLWLDQDEVIVAVGADKEFIENLATKNFGQPYGLTVQFDLGKTEVEPETLTAVAIGPVTPEEAAELGLDKLELR